MLGSWEDISVFEYVECMMPALCCAGWGEDADPGVSGGGESDGWVCCS